MNTKGTLREHGVCFKTDLPILYHGESYTSLTNVKCDLQYNDQTILLMFEHLHLLTCI